MKLYLNIINRENMSIITHIIMRTPTGIRHMSEMMSQQERRLKEVQYL